MSVRDDAIELAELRNQAEDQMRARDARLPELSAVEIKQLVFELGTHQIELEMQNEELRRTQIQVSESRDIYTELYDFAPVGYLTIDQNSRILQANLTVAKLFGVDRKSLMGQHLMTFAHRDDADDLFLTMRNHVPERPSVSIELRLTTGAGDEFHARLDIGTLKNADGNDGRRLVAITDITEVKRAEAERSELQQRLQQRQRLESLGVLAGGIAHDFNNLMTSVSLNNDIVANSLAQDSTLRSNTDQITFAVGQSTALCEQMLAYSGKGTFEQCVFDVSRMLQDTSKLLRSSITKNVSLEMRLLEDLPQVHGDPAQIRQVALNLVMNASESIEGQGHVSVSSRVTNDRDPSLIDAISSTQLMPGEYVCIEVADTGCGLSPSDVSKIFEPFYTTKFAGRGLGMSVVSGIVHRHKGSILVNSVKERGTTISVLLPIAESTALESFNSSENETQDREELRDSQDVRALGAVLVVDDEPLVRFAMQASLESDEFSVLSAECGDQAIEILRENTNAISVVLLDLTMPGLSFDATISGLRRIRNDVPIILMSGHSESDISALLVEKEVTAFLPKPTGSPVELIERVLRSEH